MKNRPAIEMITTRTTRPAPASSAGPRRSPNADSSSAARAAGAGPSNTTRLLLSKVVNGADGDGDSDDDDDSEDREHEVSKTNKKA